MDGLIQHYLQARENIIGLIQNRAVYNSVMHLDQEAPSTPPLRPARSSQFSKSPKTVESKPSEPKTPKITETTPKAQIAPKLLEIKSNEPKTPTVNPDFASTSKYIDSSPTTHRSSKLLPSIAKIFNTPKRKEVVMQPTANVKTVSCPVCSVDISEHHVNVHLDACLKREVAQGKIAEKP